MNNIGIIGLGVMGSGLALNIADKSYSVSLYDYTKEYTEKFMKQHGKDGEFSSFFDIKEFVNSLELPRKIILMTKAGRAVDDMIESLNPYLSENDLIMDCGNTYFKDTDRRIKYLEEKKILYLGIGVSGGEYGALTGPSIMPGGSCKAYQMVEKLLLSMAAKTSDGSCATYIGGGSSGHFVKMVHNGIEYGIMQSISEIYHIMRLVLKMENTDISDVFKKWNDTELNSYLVEITYKILKKNDDITKNSLVDMILDKAGQNGTGKWTSEVAFELGIPTTSINASVEARQLSFFKEQREIISKMINKEFIDIEFDRDEIINKLEDTLKFNIFILFSQGIWLINQASIENNYNIDVKEVLKVWRGGCIIRAKMLDLMIEVLDEENINLILSKKSIDFLMKKVKSVKDTINIAMDFYIPTICLNTSLDYFFSLIENRLPANLIQAQRDYFGAHTYERIDDVGKFHTKWEN